MRALGLSLLASVTFTALALPTGFAVAEGEASISSADKTLRVAQTTADAQINWSGFDIAADERVHFELPNNSSVSRNMISGNASTIAGTLSSNGRLFLSNPAGIFFTPEATIDAASVVANSDNGLIEFNSKVNTNELNLQASSINIAGVNLAQDNLDIRLIGDDIVIGQNVALNLNHSQWIVAGENVDNQAQVKLSADSYYYEGQNKTYARALPNMTHKTDRSMAHFEQVKGKLWFKGRDELLADSNKVTYFSSGAQVDLDLALDWQLEDKLPGVSQYLYGDDYHENVAHYKAIRANYKPGVDLKYYGNSSDALELDVIVAPYADPQVALTFSSTPEKQGEFLKLTDGIMLDAPVAYQQTENGRRIVESSFKVEGNTVGFNLGDYDVSKELVIDPITVGYATWFTNANGASGVVSLNSDDDNNYYLAVDDSRTGTPGATTTLFGTRANSKSGLHKFNNNNSLQFSAYFPISKAINIPVGFIAVGDSSVYFTSKTDTNTFSTELPALATTKLQGTLTDNNRSAITIKLNKTTGALENYTFYGASEDESFSFIGSTTVGSDGSLFIAGHVPAGATNFMSTAGLNAKPDAANEQGIIVKVAGDLGSLTSYRYFGANGANTRIFVLDSLDDNKLLIAGDTGVNLQTAGQFDFPSDGTNLGNLAYGTYTNTCAYYGILDENLTYERGRGVTLGNTGTTGFYNGLKASGGGFYLSGFYSNSDANNFITLIDADNTNHPNFSAGAINSVLGGGSQSTFLLKFDSLGRATAGTHLSQDQINDYVSSMREGADSFNIGFSTSSQAFFNAMPSNLRDGSLRQSPINSTASTFVSFSKDLATINNFNMFGSGQTKTSNDSAILPNGATIFSLSTSEAINISTSYPSVTGQLQNTNPSGGAGLFLYRLTSFFTAAGTTSNNSSSTVNTNETLRQIPPSVLNVATTTTTTTTINTNTPDSNSDSSTIDSLLDSGTADEGSESGDGESADNKKKKSSTTQQPAKTDTQSDTTANPEASSVLTKELGEGVTLYSEDNGVTWKDGSGVRYEFINGEWVRVQ